MERMQLQQKNTMVEEMLKSFSRLFLNILSISLENIKPMGNFFLKAGDLSEIRDQFKSAWGDIGGRELTISARSAEQDPTKNIFHIAIQRLCQEALDWNLSHWQENLWNYYINQKEKGENTDFFVHEKFLDVLNSVLTQNASWVHIAILFCFKNV